MAKLKDGNRVITNKCRLSFPHLFEPYGMDGQEPKYSCMLLIPKDDEETVNLLKQVAEEVVNSSRETLGKNYKLKEDFLRDGDKEIANGGRPADRTEYIGHYFINCSSRYQPIVVDASREKIEDPEQVYAGCYVKADIKVYAYNVSGNKGIAFGINALQKVGKGERLAGGGASADGFDIEDTDEDDEFDI